MVASGGWAFLSIREAQKAAMLQTAKRDLSNVQEKELCGGRVKVIHQVSETALHFSEAGLPIRKTLKQLGQLLREYAAVSPAVSRYREEVSCQLFILDSVSVQLAYSSLHGMLENVIRDLNRRGESALSGKVKAIQDRINLDEVVDQSPAQVREIKIKIRELLYGKKTKSGECVDDESSITGLLKRYSSQFGDQCAYIQDTVIAETKENLKHSGSDQQNLCLFIPEGDTPLATALNQLDREIAVLSPKLELLNKWNEEKIPLWHKAIKMCTPAYPNQKPLLLGATGLFLAIFGTFYRYPI